MSKDEVSRRVVLGAIGIGAASAAIAESLPLHRSAAAAAGSVEAGESDPAATEARAEACALLAPLAAGSRLGRWTVEQVLPLEDGAASVVLCDAEGGRFQLDVCARDGDLTASRGPGQSELFEVFLANQGDGETSTFEDHGLAAMALAELIRTNEQHIERTAFQTLRQRVEARRARRHVT
jgi:hypothetical protein